MYLLNCLECVTINLLFGSREILSANDTNWNTECRFILISGYIEVLIMWATYENFLKLCIEKKVHVNSDKWHKIAWIEAFFDENEQVLADLRSDKTLMPMEQAFT